VLRASTYIETFTSKLQPLLVCVAGRLCRGIRLNSFLMATLELQIMIKRLFLYCLFSLPPGTIRDSYWIYGIIATPSDDEHDQEGRNSECSHSCSRTILLLCTTDPLTPVIALLRQMSRWFDLIVASARTPDDRKAPVLFPRVCTNLAEI
jgi:hypothetical protein